MADDGYLIGFEDSSGNFVEVGRFNNLSGNTSDPVFIEHTGSGTRMELDGSGFDMNGNDITNAGSVNTESLVIGGTLYEEDANSPANQTNISSYTYTVNNPADEIIIIPEAGDDANLLQNCQVNGDTNSNYTTTDTSDSQTSGSAFEIENVRNYSYLKLHGLEGFNIGFHGEYLRSGTSISFRGENSNATPPITQFTLFPNSGNEDVKFRVFRRVMNI